MRRQSIKLAINRSEGHPGFIRTHTLSLLPYHVCATPPFRLARVILPLPQRLSAPVEDFFHLERRETNA